MLKVLCLVLVTGSKFVILCEYIVIKELKINNTKYDLDTPIYKYLSLESFLHFMQFKQIMCSKISKWPDAYEGGRFDFFKKIKKDDSFSTKTKGDFLGCSWTLQNENSSIYENKLEHEKAEEELENEGSAAMWESYCPNGGVRIKTTIGKVINVLLSKDDQYNFFRGCVYYEPSHYWDKTLKAKELISLLFMKRVSFRHESEYRFILSAKNHSCEDFIYFYIDNVYDFIDEFLISPATKSREWISKALYQCAVGITCIPTIHGTNHKNGKQYCRISSLYGYVSEEI